MTINFRFSSLFAAKSQEKCGRMENLLAVTNVQRPAAPLNFELDIKNAETSLCRKCKSRILIHNAILMEIFQFYEILILF